MESSRVTVEEADFNDIVLVFTEHGSRFTLRRHYRPQYKRLCKTHTRHVLACHFAIEADGEFVSSVDLLLACECGVLSVSPRRR